MIMKKSVLCLAVAGAGLVLVPFSAALADGKETYEKVCKMCHATGVATAPKFADKAAWAPRIAKGTPVLDEHAIKGFKDKGVMPPKGGRATLSDDDVKAAVAYMVEKSQ
jgi:cytochrome c5